jgi:recombination protein RecA
MATEDVFYDALKHLRKKEGMFLETYEEISRLPTEVVGFDWLLGGGVPLGRIVEIFGLEGSGKTTVAAEIAKTFQRSGRRVIYLDYEHSVDLQWFSKLGVDCSDDSDRWLFEQPMCLEEGMDAVIKLVATGGIGLVIFDSVASMAPKAEVEGQVVDNSIGLQARKMGQSLRSLVGLLGKHDTTALFINQLRFRIGSFSTYNPYITPGGLSLKFHSSVRLELKKLKKPTHRAKLVKQKTAPLQIGQVEFDITKDGIDHEQHLISCLVKTVVKNKAGSYFFEGEKIARGEEELTQYVKDDEHKQMLVTALMAFWDETHGDVKEEWDE